MKFEKEFVVERIHYRFEIRPDNEVVFYVLFGWKKNGDFIFTGEEESWWWSGEREIAPASLLNFVQNPVKVIRTVLRVLAGGIRETGIDEFYFIATEPKRRKTYLKLCKKINGFDVKIDGSRFFFTRSQQQKEVDSVPSLLI